MVIYIVSDGKKGHLSQTRGLAQALTEKARQKRPGDRQIIHEMNVEHMSWYRQLLHKGDEADVPPPRLILCAGHGTHLAALSIARHWKVPCIVCMKPSLPVFLFDLCVTPRHDLKGNATKSGKIFPTIGAINTIRPHPEVAKKSTLILIGGPSKDYDWDAEMILNQLSTIARQSVTPIILTTSRRTPTDFAGDVARLCPSIRVVPVGQTGDNWVAEKLAEAKEVWVTQDSVSMVYEALSSAAPVGILEMPRKGTREKPKASRVARGLDMLMKDGSVSTFTQWAATHSLPHAPMELNEAARAADYILQRFPILLTP